MASSVHRFFNRLQKTSAGPNQQRSTRRLRIESLETRALLAAFIVNTPYDTWDAAPGDGVAADSNGMTSLRAAVMEANALGGSHSIELAAENYSLLRGVTGAPGTLPITADITIIGAGASLSQITTADLFRLFDVRAGASLALAGLTLSGGTALDGASGGAFGGSISTAGHLSIRDSTIRDSVAASGGGGIWVTGVSGTAEIHDTLFLNNRAGWGGAVATRSGTISVSDSHFQGNSAVDRGGALQNEFGNVTAATSTFTQNYVGSSPSQRAGSGGAIHNNGQMALDAIIVDHNTAWFGGGIRNTSQMTITSSVISDNASASTGGGLSNWDGSLVVEDSTISGNTGTFGGALWSNSSAVIANSIVSDNQVTQNGGAVSNAGVGTLEISGSTLARNSALWGGAILNGATASLQLVNSTLSGNSAIQDGGGIHNWGPLTVTHSTLTANRANSNGNSTGIGGGIRSNQVAVSLRNTIVAGNFWGPNDQVDDVRGSVSLLSSHNLIGDAASSGGLLHGSNGNIVGNAGVGTLPIDSVLDIVLAEHGGPTPTHALVRGSRAIDSGTSLPDVSVDQRGESRFIGDASDIGAYEVQPADPGFNSAPQAIDDFYSLYSGEPLQLDASQGVLENDIDAEDDPLIAILMQGPQYGTLEFGDDGSFVYTPNAEFVGVDSFTYRTSDGLLQSNAATVTLQVQAVQPSIQIGDGSGTIDLANPWITVAILGSSRVDVTQINLSSLRFGVEGTENSIEVSGRGSKASIVYQLLDLDGDGYLDLVARFDTKKTMLTLSHSEVILAGILAGKPFSLTQPVNVILSAGGGGNGNGGGKGKK